MRLAAAVASLLVLLLAAATAEARPRALVAYLPTEPAPRMPLLFDLAERGLSYGLVSPTLGGYTRRQMALDTGQGARISTRAYDEPVPDLRLVARRGGGFRIARWSEAVERAEDAPGEAVPGLLADTVRRSGGRVAYAGVLGFEQLEALTAADAAGRIPEVGLFTIGRFGDDAARLWRDAHLLVARLPADAAGLAALDRLLAARRAEDTVVVLRAPPAGRLRLLPAGIAGPGFRGGPIRSSSTRLTGFVAAPDIAPTVLDRLGLAVPAEMSGRVIEERSGGSPEAVRSLAARFDVVVGRRVPLLNAALATLLVLLGVLALVARRDGVRAWLRLVLLSALWLPALALLTAALRPTRTAEVAIILGGSLVLAAATDRLLPWPRGPALPVAVVFLAHTIDLAAGSLLIDAAVTGPNPKGGARFFGIGNELETILALSVIFGIGGAVALRRDRTAPRAFAAGTAIAAFVIGWGRLGADVGGVITLAAGGAAAVLASLPGGPSRRALVIAVAAPAAALVALVALDLLSGGGAHLSRTVLDAESPGDLVEVVERRFRISFGGLAGGSLSVAGAVALLALAAWRRKALLAPLGTSPGLRAALIGGWFATVVGALANDSGPLILLVGAVMLLFALAYAHGRPWFGRREAGTMDGCA
ncbi:MAG TPA: hypothetical protein VNT32_02695 [Thermoleophilaceae bacterium]|nr:hypothetical protein [Thermoleophilaceae bacterium]